jgi:hypothetical protein
MMQYTRFVNGIATDQWTSVSGSSTYTDQSWGSPKTYAIVSKDITVQINAIIAFATSIRSIRLNPKGGAI